MKKFVPYMVKWQLGTLIMSPCVYFLSGFGSFWSVVIGNLIGAIVFFPIDRKIFEDKEGDRE